MRRRSICVLAAVVGVALGGAALAPALAQDAYPSRPIRMIIPFSAGGPTDIVGRLLAERMGQQMGQRIVVENRTGAGVVVGADAVAKAPKDGYTFLYGTVSLAVTPAMFRQLPFDPVRDFTPAALTAKIPTVLLVNPNTIPAQTYQEFVAYARANEGRLTYGGGGQGTAGHMSSELFLSLAGIKMPVAQYRGNSPAMIDLLGGRIAFVMGIGAEAVNPIREGRLRGLVVSADRRLPQIPDVPAAPEVGLPGWEAYTWQMIWLPAGTPMEIVRRLNAEANTALRDPGLRQRLTADAATIIDDSTPESAAAYMAAEFNRWVPIMRAAGVVPQ
ncbi:MAG: tripartite tricarboxylate transporter substrate binding protein [Alphaproteobacteria bacterium]|nr:tripartite tricarboxylate transporter substrate binding protein [Alphaproteobacteria bacterium]